MSLIRILGGGGGQKKKKRYFFAFFFFQYDMHTRRIGWLKGTVKINGGFCTCNDRQPTRKFHLQSNGITNRSRSKPVKTEQTFKNTSNDATTASHI